MITLGRAILALGITTFSACGHSGEIPPVAVQSISGKVLLSGESDHAGIVVRLAGPVTNATVTGSDGSYAFSGVTKGTYAIIADARSTDEGELTASVVVGEGSTTAPDLSFSPRGDLAGTATLGAKTGNAGIVIAVAGSSAFAITDDEGHYALRSAPTGAHDVIASRAGFDSAIAKSVGVKYATTTNVPDLALGKSVAGKGSLTGKAILRGESDSSGIVITLSGVSSSATTTDASGAFAFSSLPDGTYTVQASAKSTLERTSARSSMIAGGSSTIVPEIDFSPVGTLTGVATLGGATIGNAGIVVFATGTTAAAFTDDAGNYTMPNVPTGPRTVQATKAGHSTGSATVPDVKYATTGTVPPIALTVDPSVKGSFSGVARMFGLTKHAGTTVKLGTIGTATTAGDGAFAMSTIPSSTYPLAFDNGGYHTRLPEVMVLPAGAFLFDGTLYALPEIEMPRGVRIGDVQLSSFGGAPVAAPRNVAVVFSGWTKPPYSYETSSLFVATIPGGVVTELEHASDYTFSDDGTTLLYRAWPPGTDASALTLKAVPISGGAPVSIGKSQYCNPGWSHPESRGCRVTVDGKSVLWWEPSSTGGLDLNVAPLAGGSKTKLASSTTKTFPLQPLLTTPDGKAVVTLASGSFGDGLAWIPIGSGTPRLLSSNIVFDQPTMLADGRTIWFESAYYLGSYRIALNTASPDGLVVRTIDPDVAGAGPDYATISPDGKTVLYLECPGSCDPSGYTLHSSPITSGSPTTLATGVTTELGFSPDSKSAYYVEGWSGSAGGTLHVVPAAGGTSTTIASGVFRAKDVRYAHATSFSPDSTRIAFFTSLSTDGWATGTLESAPATGGTAATLASGIGGDYTFTSDSKRVVTRTFAEGALHSIGVDGTGDTLLAKPVELYVPSPGGAKLLVASESVGVCTSGCFSVYTWSVIDLATSARTFLMTGMGAVWLGDGNIVTGRAASSPPLRFQDGIYLTATP